MVEVFGFRFSSFEVQYDYNLYNINLCTNILFKARFPEYVIYIAQLHTYKLMLYKNNNNNNYYYSYLVFIK